jgi:hypothetical protein
MWLVKIDHFRKAELSRVIEGYVKALEATEIERRLRLLEERAIGDAK